jgi:hypothetical protein
MTTGVATSPSEYITNTDETDALALDVTAELAVGESVADAACELLRVLTREDVSSTAFPTGAAVVGNVVTQRFDARVLASGHYQWNWNCTLNTGAVRSFTTTLKVENHD